MQLRRGSTPQSGRATYYFNQAVERDATDGDACFNLGYAYWLDKDPMAAAYWLREAVRRESDRRRRAFRARGGAGRQRRRA